MLMKNILFIKLVCHVFQNYIPDKYLAFNICSQAFQHAKPAFWSTKPVIG